MSNNTESKKCSTCKETKLTSEFYYRSDSKRYRSDCKKCMQTKSTLRWKTDPDFRQKGKERNRRWQRQNFYDLSLQEEMCLKAHQANCCGICNAQFKSDGDYHVDHCHVTNQIRGLLCPLCNKGLGLFKDNPVVLKKAASYVESNGVGFSFDPKRK